MGLIERPNDAGKDALYIGLDKELVMLCALLRGNRAGVGAFIEVAVLVLKSDGKGDDRTAF